jgi:hypothetical protein
MLAYSRSAHFQGPLPVGPRLAAPGGSRENGGGEGTSYIMGSNGVATTPNGAVVGTRGIVGPRDLSALHPPPPHFAHRRLQDGAGPSPLQAHHPMFQPYMDAAAAGGLAFGSCQAALQAQAAHLAYAQLAQAQAHGSIPVSAGLTAWREPCAPTPLSETGGSFASTPTPTSAPTEGALQAAFAADTLPPARERSSTPLQVPEEESQSSWKDFAPDEPCCCGAPTAAELQLQFPGSSTTPGGELRLNDLLGILDTDSSNRL